MASATGEKPLERANQLLSALRSQTSPPIKDLLWGHVKAGVAALLRHYGDDAISLLVEIHDALGQLFSSKETAAFFASAFALVGFASRLIESKAQSYARELAICRPGCPHKEDVLTLLRHRATKALFWEFEEAFQVLLLDLESVLWASTNLYQQNRTKRREAARRQLELLRETNPEATMPMEPVVPNEMEIHPTLTAREGYAVLSEYSNALKETPLHDAVLQKKMPWEKIPPMYTTFSTSSGDNPNTDNKSLPELGVTIVDQCVSIAHRIRTVLVLLCDEFMKDEVFIRSLPIAPVALIQNLTKLLDERILIALCTYDDEDDHGILGKLSAFAAAFGLTSKTLNPTYRAQIRLGLLQLVENFTRPITLARRITWTHDGRFPLCARYCCYTPRIRPPFDKLQPYFPKSMFVSWLGTSSAQMHEAKLTQPDYNESRKHLYPSVSDFCLAHHKEFIQSLLSLNDVNDMLTGPLKGYFPYVESLYSQNTTTFAYQIWGEIRAFESIAYAASNLAAYVQSQRAKQKPEHSTVATPMLQRELIIPPGDKRDSSLEENERNLYSYYAQIRKKGAELIRSTEKWTKVWLNPTPGSPFPVEITEALNDARFKLSSCIPSTFELLKGICEDILKKHFHTQFLRSKLHQQLIQAFGDLSVEAVTALASTREQRLEALHRAEELIKAQRRERRRLRRQQEKQQEQAQQDGEGNEDVDASGTVDDLPDDNDEALWFAEDEKDRWKKWFKEMAQKQRQQLNEGKDRKEPSGKDNLNPNETDSKGEELKDPVDFPVDMVPLDSDQEDDEETAALWREEELERREFEATVTRLVSKAIGDLPDESDESDSNY